MDSRRNTPAARHSFTGGDSDKQVYSRCVQACQDAAEMHQESAARLRDQSPQESLGPPSEDEGRSSSNRTASGSRTLPAGLRSVAAAAPPPAHGAARRGLRRRACLRVAGRCCNLDLKTQVWQLHKDYAKGLEASRRKVFPNARPCDDYPHMRRASYSTLKEKMGAVGGRGAQLDVQQQRRCNSTYV